MTHAPDALGPLIIDIDGGESLSRTERLRLTSPWVGGVILFSRNFEDRHQLRALTREVKSLRHPELLITVDQEGGRVQRFRGRFTRLPPAAVCGQLYDSKPKAGMQLARDVGLVMAAELVECEVDLSFAPVLDVLSCSSEVIGDRAFHSDPEAVHFLALSHIEGMHDAGMGAVGKHFPGHGGVSEDSHNCLPVDERSMAAMRNCDLLPYSSLGRRLQGVMLAHVLYKSINAHIPSFSSFWVRDVLREELRFQGAVFSDDLSMAGAGDEPLSERCLNAQQAGCDLLPICNNLPAVDQLLAELNDHPDTDSTAVINRLYAAPKEVDKNALSEARRRLQETE